MTELLTVTARLLLAPALVVAAAILVKGYADVGDGFAAGVIVLLVVALQYIALGTEQAEAAMPVLRAAPRIAVAGLLLALACVFFPLLSGAAPVSHLPAPGHEPVVVGTLELTTAVAFDVGVFLAVSGGLTVLVHQLAHEEHRGPDRPPPPGRDGEART